ncbi:MAG: tetratricopeptide repeat protein, partial [Myxococcales bacterium]|nr:tetratricopeptide repeat protein [Myxococcales bacterium]
MGSTKNELLLGELEPSWSGVAPAPRAGPAMDARERARLRETLDAYEREIAASVDPRRRAALSHEVGRIHEDAFGDERQAIREYQRAFRADPTHLPTLVAVRRLFIKARKWAMVARVLDAEMRARTRPADRARLLCEKGDLHLLRFNDADGAVRAFEAAVGLDPESVRAVAGLVRAAGLAGRRAQSADALIALADWVDDAGAAATVRLQAADELADARPVEAAALARMSLQASGGLARGWAFWGELEADAGLETVASAVGAPGARARLLLEAARRRRPDDPERALSLAREAVGLAPLDPLGWDLVAELEQAGGHWAAAAEALEEGTRAASSVTDRVDRLWRLADLRLQRLDDVDGAVDALRRLLVLEPGWPPALERVERLLASQGDWEGVAQVRLTHLVSVTEPHDRADGWFRMGVLYEEHLGDPERAADAYRAAVLERGDFLDASKALGRILLARGDWVGYAELLQEEADRVSALEQRVRLLTRVAEIAEERLDQPEWALAACRRILSERPDHGPTAARAGRLLAHLGRWAELLEINEHEFEDATSPGHRLALLVRSGEICARELGDAQRALEYLERALALAPRYAPALELATAILQRQGDWHGLVALLRRQLAVAHGGEERARLAFRIGEVLRDRLGDDDGALAAFEEARAVAVDDVPTLLALAALHHQRAAYRREYEVLGAALERLDRMEDRAEVLFRMGELAERVGNGRDAVDAWEPALAQQPEHRGAATALLRAYERERDAAAVATLRRTLARSATDDGEAIVHWAAVGRAACQEASLRTTAIEAFEAIATLTPDDLGALLMLERLYLAGGELERVADVLGRLSQAAHSLPLRAEFLARRARLRMDELEDLEGAVADFRVVLEWVPDHAEALARVERFAARMGDVEVLAAVLEQRLATAGSDKERVLILERAGEALWRAGRLRDAVRCYDAVVALDQQSITALRALRSIYRDLGEAEASAAMTEAEGQQALDPQNAVRLLLEAGSAREAVRKDPRAALADYRAAL